MDAMALRLSRSQLMQVDLISLPTTTTYSRWPLTRRRILGENDFSRWTRRDAKERRVMMTLDPVFLSRMQWVWVIAWHILLPAFTVGLASYIAVLEGLFFFRREDIWLRLSRFWIRIFAVSFAMGVVSGIVMPFQFGTNWSRFSDAVANVVSPMMAYEGLMAFFLEAAFLGILLFGRRLVPRWAHFFSASMVAIGTLFSSFWILSVNSWMQTPAGFEIEDDGRFFPISWLAIVFNPSFPYRLAHNVSGFYVTTGFVVLGVGAYLFRRGSSVEEARRMVLMALGFLALFVPLQIALGDLHGLNTRDYQPAKLAAIEARWETTAPVPLTLFAIPDQQGERNLYAIDIPYLGSLILTHSLNGGIKGLKQWPPDERPPVWPVFFAFRVMVGIGLVMLVVVSLGWFLRIRGQLFETGWFLRLCQWTAPLGFVAVLAGWITTEVGRQPWTVYGLMRTAQSVSPSLTGFDVLLSLLAYVAIYLLMFPAGLAVMARLVRQGPAEDVETRIPVEGLRPQAPFSNTAE
jgi:cytochrome bd ubiquinol oxidase subunit I